jgi:hypothetical protein
MDPYLEGSLWTSVHVQLAAEIARQLAPQLRPRYLALPAERFVLEAPDDVAVTPRGLYPAVSVIQVRPTSLDTDTALAPPPLQLETVIPESIAHVTIEIRDAANRQLVTAIEVLSPTNKRGDGRTEYLTKRRHILISSAHLIEIDLLRQGPRVPMRQPLPAAPYFVLVGRAELRPLVDVWPVQLTDRLPVVPVPLLPADADVPLDLQAALTAVYDGLNYDLAVDYRQPPEIPLAPQEEAWADALLRAAGLRPGGTTP